MTWSSGGGARAALRDALRPRLDPRGPRGPRSRAARYLLVAVASAIVYGFAVARSATRSPTRTRGTSTLRRRHGASGRRSASASRCSSSTACGSGPRCVVGGLLAGDYSTPFGLVLGQIARHGARRRHRRRPARAPGRAHARPARPRRAHPDRLRRRRHGARREPRPARDLARRRPARRSASRSIWRTWWLSDLTGRADRRARAPDLGHDARCGPTRSEALEGAALLAALVVLTYVSSQRDVPYVALPRADLGGAALRPRGAADGAAGRLPRSPSGTPRAARGRSCATR